MNEQVICHRPGSWGSRTGEHRYRADGTREHCPTCDYQPLAIARTVDRRPWWRRLLAWRPASAPRPLMLAPPMRVELVALDEFGVPLWRVRPCPRSLPSDGSAAPR